MSTVLCSGLARALSKFLPTQQLSPSLQLVLLRLYPASSDQATSVPQVSKRLLLGVASKTVGASNLSSLNFLGWS